MDRSAGGGAERDVAGSAVIDQVVAELEAIALDASDATGYFPALYVRATREIAAGIRDDRFENGERMQRFATVFAGYSSAPRGRTDARCWRAAWDVAGDPNLLITQHLLLGTNAHINHDLPQAVVEVAREDGDLQAVRTDFDAVNGILAATMDSVIRDLDTVSRWSNEAAALGGGRLFNFSLLVARSRAGTRPSGCTRWTARRRPLTSAQLDALVSVIVYLITRPAFPVNALAALARRLEQRDPRAVTRALLGAT